MLNVRITRLEREQRFREWLTFERFLEGLTEHQLELYAQHGQLPEPLPEPLSPGSSRLDGLDRNSLNRMYEAQQRQFENRTKVELDFFCAHGHWPKQPCDEQTCIASRTARKSEEQKGRPTDRAGTKET